jgi:branched-chain amino acid transport system substrate-binding protein
MRHATPASRRRRIAAVGMAAAVVLLGATACADDSSSGGSSEASAAAVSDAPDGTFPGKAAGSDTIKVGVISPEGGPAVSQPEGRVAAQAAIDYANENLGGIGGFKIEPVICKEAEDPSSAADCANQMVEEKVAGVVVLNTAQGAAMAPIITEAGIPYTAYQGASAEELTGNPSFMWTGGFPGILAGMAKYAVTNGIKSVTLFVTDAPAVTGGAAAFGEPAFKAAGVELNIVPIPLGTPDATPQVSAGVKDAPGAIGIVGDATMCTSTLKGLGTVGFKGDKLVISQCLDPSVQKAAGDALEGSKVLSSTDGITDDPEAKLYRAVMAKYAPSGATVTGAAETGFQSMLGFIRAAQSITDPSPEATTAAITGAQKVVLPLGHGATFTCDGTALPGLTAVCSNASLVGTWTDSTIADYQLLP